MTLPLHCVSNSCMAVVLGWLSAVSATRDNGVVWAIVVLSVRLCTDNFACGLGPWAQVELAEKQMHEDVESMSKTVESVRFGMLQKGLLVVDPND